MPRTRSTRRRFSQLESFASPARTTSSSSDPIEPVDTMSNPRRAPEDGESFGSSDSIIDSMSELAVPAPRGSSAIVSDDSNARELLSTLSDEVPAASGNPSAGTVSRAQMLESRNSPRASAGTSPTAPNGDTLLVSSDGFSISEIVFSDDSENTSAATPRYHQMPDTQDYRGVAVAAPDTNDHPIGDSPAPSTLRGPSPKLPDLEATQPLSVINEVRVIRDEIEDVDDEISISHGVRPVHDGEFEFEEDNDSLHSDNGSAEDHSSDEDYAPSVSHRQSSAPSAPSLRKRKNKSRPIQPSPQKDLRKLAAKRPSVNRARNIPARRSNQRTSVETSSASPPAVHPPKNTFPRRIIDRMKLPEDSTIVQASDPLDQGQQSANSSSSPVRFTEATPQRAVANMATATTDEINEPFRDAFLLSQEESEGAEGIQKLAPSQSPVDVPVSSARSNAVDQPTHPPTAPKRVPKRSFFDKQVTAGKSAPNKSSHEMQEDSFLDMHADSSQVMQDPGMKSPSGHASERPTKDPTIGRTAATCDGLSEAPVIIGGDVWDLEGSPEPRKRSSKTEASKVATSSGRKARAAATKKTAKSREIGRKPAVSRSTENKPDMSAGKSSGIKKTQPATKNINTASKLGGRKWLQPIDDGTSTVAGPSTQPVRTDKQTRAGDGGVGASTTGKRITEGKTANSKRKRSSPPATSRKQANAPPTQSDKSTTAQINYSAGPLRSEKQDAERGVELMTIGNLDFPEDVVNESSPQQRRRKRKFDDEEAAPASKAAKISEANAISSGTVRSRSDPVSMRTVPPHNVRSPLYVPNVSPPAPGSHIAIGDEVAGSHEEFSEHMLPEHEEDKPPIPSKQPPETGSDPPGAHQNIETENQLSLTVPSKATAKIPDTKERKEHRTQEQIINSNLSNICRPPSDVPTCGEVKPGHAKNAAESQLPAPVPHESRPPEFPVGSNVRPRVECAPSPRPQPSIQMGTSGRFAVGIAGPDAQQSSVPYRRQALAELEPAALEIKQNKWPAGSLLSHAQSQNQHQDSLPSTRGNAENSNLDGTRNATDYGSQLFRRQHVRNDDNDLFGHDEQYDRGRNSTFVDRLHEASEAYSRGQVSPMRALHPRSQAFAERISLSQAREKEKGNYQRRYQYGDATRSSRTGQRSVRFELQPQRYWSSLDNNEGSPPSSRTPKHSDNKVRFNSNSQPPVSGQGSHRRWRSAVDEASDNVAESMHAIVNSVLSHLMSKGEVLDGIVSDYQRNGQRLIERILQQEEEERQKMLQGFRQNCQSLDVIYTEGMEETKQMEESFIARKDELRQIDEEGRQQYSSVQAAIYKAQEVFSRV